MMMMMYQKKCLIAFVISNNILIDSVFKMGKNYYLQVFFRESKYIVKEKKIVIRYINDSLEIFLTKKVLIKKIEILKIKC